MESLFHAFSPVLESIRRGRIGGSYWLQDVDSYWLAPRTRCARPASLFCAAIDFPDPLPGETYWPGNPDLAVEVVSPNDRSGEIDEKVRDWLDAGTTMVWVVNPAWRTVPVYHSATQIATLTENDELSGEDVIEGFHCRVGDIFAQFSDSSTG